MVVSLLRQGRPAPHREARHKRREHRLKLQAEQDELELRMRELQTANEAKQFELENMRKVCVSAPSPGGHSGGTGRGFPFTLKVFLVSCVYRTTFLWFTGSSAGVDLVNTVRPRMFTA